MPVRLSVLETDASNFPICFEEYLVWLATSKGRAENTIKSYRRDLTEFSNWIDKRGIKIETVTPQIVDRWLIALSEKGLASKSQGRALAAVRGAFGFAFSEGLLSSNPVELTETPRPLKSLPKAIEIDEVERFMSAIVGDGPLVLRDRAIAELLYGTGMRISELVNLRLEDIDYTDGFIRVLGKGSKERLVPISRLVRKAINEWVSIDGRAKLQKGKKLSRVDLETLFCNARGRKLTRQGAWLILKDYAQKCDLESKFSPHVLRHSCATHMLVRGADLRIVQELLGHASLVTTQMYTKITTNQMKSVYDSAHPRARVGLTQ